MWFIKIWIENNVLFDISHKRGKRRKINKIKFYEKADVVYFHKILFFAECFTRKVKRVKRLSYCYIYMYNLIGSILLSVLSLLHFKIIRLVCVFSDERNSSITVDGLIDTSVARVLIGVDNLSGKAWRLMSCFSSSFDLTRPALECREWLF